VEIDRPKTSRNVSFVVLFVGLAIIAAGLAVLLAMIAAEASGATGRLRDYLVLLAWLSLSLLGLTLVMLTWVMIRYIVHRIDIRGGRSSTPYVDAWSLAGRRFKLEEKDEKGGEEDEEDQEETSQ